MTNVLICINKFLVKGVVEFRDCAIIIWRGGSKISKVGLKIKLHPPLIKVKITSCPAPPRGEIPRLSTPPPQPPILPTSLFTFTLLLVCLHHQ